MDKIKTVISNAGIFGAMDYQKIKSSQMLLQFY